MSHSLPKLWIHSIFGTKNRMPLINKNIVNQVHNFIKTELEEVNCTVRIINGTSDHIHILFLLSRDYSISEIMKKIKGSSSHWINQQDFINSKFSWQVGYGAFSVSESNISKVEIYIKNQEEHHRKMSFKEEYDRFMTQHGI